MRKNKLVFLFILKSIVIFSILALPFGFFDTAYAKFYSGISKICFKKFDRTGFAVFSITKPATNMHIELGNQLQANSSGMVRTATSDVNIRYRGYIPTIFVLSLILASPVSRKRKLYSILFGIFLITVFVMIKQWIHIVYMCHQQNWISLYSFSPGTQKTFKFLYLDFANYNGSSIIFSIVIWILVTFKRRDLENFKLMPEEVNMNGKMKSVLMK